MLASSHWLSWHSGSSASRPCPRKDVEFVGHSITVAPVETPASSLTTTCTHSPMHFLNKVPTPVLRLHCSLHCYHLTGFLPACHLLCQELLLKPRPDRITHQLRSLWRMDYQAVIKQELRSLLLGIETGTTSMVDNLVKPM